MFLIPLTQERFALVDDEDADLASFKWHAAKRDKTFYAMRNVNRPDGSKTKESLHQIIASRMGIAGEIDHRNRGGLDCRRGNLRGATRRQNNANHGLQRNNTSGFKGVSFDARRGKWQARIKFPGKYKFLGYYLDPIEAARVYDEAARVAFGELASPNLPHGDK